MKRIKLTQNKWALVSDKDYTYLMQWKWYAVKQKKNWYACTGHKSIRMHRLVAARLGINCQKIDHRNRNGLDNCRNNLRPATAGQNAINRPKNSNNTSGFKGVSLDRRRNKWQATIRVKTKLLFLGYFEHKRDAAKVYNKAALRYFGKFSYTNKF
jgi:hypothetical protein